MAQVNLVRLTQLIDQADGEDLHFRPYQPGWPDSLPRGGSMFEHLRHHDCLLHHPFESFDAVVSFLREAVYDPDVLAIKQTIYRTGSQSVLMESAAGGGAPRQGSAGRGGVEGPL